MYTILTSKSKGRMHSIRHYIGFSTLFLENQALMAFHEAKTGGRVRKLGLQPLGRHCPLCGETMWAAYHNYRTITNLEDVLHPTLQIRRCLNRACPQFRRPDRPEAEGRLALPKHEFGLDVIAWVGTLRYAQHRSLPEIHQHLRHRGVAIVPRTVTHLLV